jgi:hypothetical protein
VVTSVLCARGQPKLAIEAVPNPSHQDSTSRRGDMFATTTPQPSTTGSTQMENQPKRHLRFFKYMPRLHAPAQSPKLLVTGLGRACSVIGVGHLGRCAHLQSNHNLLAKL